MGKKSRNGNNGARSGNGNIDCSSIRIRNDREPMSFSIQSLCVFCGAQTSANPAFEASAREVGSYLADNKIRLVYGGGSVGMMGAVADACLEAGGEVIGVITTYLQSRELGHPGITEMRVVETMLERKQVMADLSDGFISLPGGIGTLDELFEMLTWSRLSVHDKPSGVLNVDGFYDELISFTQKTQVEAGFISADDAANLIHSTTLSGLLAQLESSIEQGPSSLYRK